MKITVIVILLVCGCATSTYSQINQRHKRNLIAKGIAGFNFKTDSLFTDGGMINTNDFSKHNMIGLFSSNDIRWTTGRAATKSDSYHMPCYKPDGVYSMRVLNPDTTTTYTILSRRF